MEKEAKVFVTNHDTMIGAAIVRRLKQQDFKNIIVKASSKLDLTNQRAVSAFFNKEKPDYVFLTSIKAGGIMANVKFPADFIYSNLQAQNNVIDSAWKTGAKKLLFLASSCIYPKECPQPMKEEYLMQGKLEPTSEPYAIAKIAGIRMCQSYNRQYGTHFLSAIPADVYGPDDDFDPETSHFLPAQLRKMHEARINNEPEVIVWGTGTPRRECLYVDDLADACIFLIDNYDSSDVINIGSGEDVSIKDVSELIRKITGFKGMLVFDTSKPDGAPRKLLDITKLGKLGWAPKMTPEEGIARTYRWYKSHPGK